jgi:hypothetical protein
MIRERRYSPYTGGGSPSAHNPHAIAPELGDHHGPKELAEDSASFTLHVCSSIASTNRCLLPLVLALLIATLPVINTLKGERNGSVSTFLQFISHSPLYHVPLMC